MRDRQRWRRHFCLRSLGRQECLPHPPCRLIVLASALLTAGVLLALPVAGAAAGESDDFSFLKRKGDIGPCGRPPKPPPKHTASAEGLPPLPLPVVPQRRSEDKKPPSPPVIITKLKTSSRLDWRTDPNDVNNLLEWMQKALGVRFSGDVRPVRRFATDPDRGSPIVYRTGHNAFTFSSEERRRLREFLLNGGFVIFDTCCGREQFFESAVREINRIFPERRLKSLPPDHPIFRSYYDIQRVRYTPAARARGRADGPPELMGLTVNCRTSLILSRWDMSCGWDSHTHKDSAGFVSRDALKLGANLIAYATATRAMGRSLRDSRVLVDADPNPAGKLVLAQLIHGGDWNPRPGALSLLLDFYHSTTGVPVRFERQRVRPTDDGLFDHPLVYVTGHDDFTWSAREVAALRKYIDSGGFIFAEACCGREAFDRAFRREMAKVLGTRRLAPLPQEHAIFRAHTPTARAHYTPAALARLGKKLPAGVVLEGATDDEGHLAVVYSPFALGAGWEMNPGPYCVGLEGRDALAVGLNVISYALTR